MKYSIFYLITFIFLYSSCASSYKSVIENKKPFEKVDSTESVSLAYSYYVLDKKYNKKEHDNGIKLIKVKIHNQSNNDLIFNKHIKLLNEEGDTIELLTPPETVEKVRQNTSVYLLYLLLTPLVVNFNLNGFLVRSYKVGYGIGPGIAFFNMVQSLSANNKFLKEFEAYNLNQKVIEKQSYLIGMIAFRAAVRENLKLVVISKD